MRPPPVEAVSGRKNTWEEMKSEDSGFSSGAVPRGGARSGDCICRGVYKYLGWQHSLSVFRRNRYCGEPLSDRYRSAARVPSSSVNNGETYAGKNFVLTADIDLNKAPLDADCKRLFPMRCLAAQIIVSSLAILTVRDIPSPMWPSGQRTPRWNQTYSGFPGVTEGKISNLHLNTVSIHGKAKNVSGYVIGLAGGLIGSASGKRRKLSCDRFDHDDEDTG